LSLADWRDVILIATGLLAILCLVGMFILIVILGLGALLFGRTAQTIVRDDVRPALDSGRQTVKQVQGTSTFISEQAVRPVIRAYGIVAGTRRAAAVLTGLARRDQPPPAPEGKESANGS
jgi:hypothetical protein